MTRSGSKRRMSVVLGGLVVAAAALVTPGSASAESATTTDRVTVSDGTSIAVTVTGEQPLAARPTVVEFTPYGASGAAFAVGPDYNYLLVQIRGTGDSNGSFDALGPKGQQDVVDVLEWACTQSWSDGRLAVAGFSASAIMIFNSLHHELPCVKAAVLRSGTFELYRDLLMPGGIPNTLVGLGVVAMIGAPTLQQAPERMQRDPASSVDALLGILTTGLNGGLLHMTLDDYWTERGFRGDANHLPTLFLDGAFDVEPRGDYQGFQHLRAQGTPAQLQVTGAHDGAPAGTDNGQRAIERWLDRYVRGVENGVEDEPAVQMYISEGSRQSLLAGQYTRVEADDWPIPGTTWESLYLTADRSGGAVSANDGSLSLAKPATSTRQWYLALPSLFTQTDPHLTALVDGAASQALSKVPGLTETNLSNLVGLTYTTPALKQDVTAVGPGTLEISLSSLMPATGIWAVVSDVAPDGTAHPMTTARLNTAYPDIVEDKSVYRDGRLVQPYGDFSTVKLGGLGQTRTYHVEMWPVTNVFKAGHRIQVTLVGQSIQAPLGLPSLNSVVLGGAQASSLTFPVAPGSDLAAALVP